MENKGAQDCPEPPGPCLEPRKAEGRASPTEEQPALPPALQSAYVPRNPPAASPPSSQPAAAPGCSSGSWGGLGAAELPGSAGSRVCGRQGWGCSRAVSLQIHSIPAFPAFPAHALLCCWYTELLCNSSAQLHSTEGSRSLQERSIFPLKKSCNIFKC